MILTERHIRKCVNNLLMGVYSGDRYSIRTTLNSASFTVYIYDKENDLEILLIADIDGRDILHPIHTIRASVSNKNNHYIYNDRSEDQLHKNETVQDQVLYDTLRAWAVQRIKEDFTILDEKAINSFKLSE